MSSDKAGTLLFRHRNQSSCIFQSMTRARRKRESATQGIIVPSCTAQARRYTGSTKSDEGEHIIARLYGKHRRVFAAGVIADGVHDQVVGQRITPSKLEFLAEMRCHLG